MAAISRGASKNRQIKHVVDVVVVGGAFVVGTVLVCTVVVDIVLVIVVSCCGC